MSNVYDVLFARPRLRKKLPFLQEKLARAIVAGGRMRLDAEIEANFTRLLAAADDINLTFTRRELTTPRLLRQSHERLSARLSARHGANAPELARQYLDKANQDLRRRPPVSAEIELMMARALVLCNALPVIRLIHLEGAEIFASFGHSVGEMMDVVNWQELGDNNGLQAVGCGENAVYVSCGGNPFLEEKERRHTGDGFPALARFMVIAAQETGHNADMIRGPGGQWVGRFSASGWSRAPSAKAGPARKADIARCGGLYDRAQARGLNRLCEWERKLKFYQDLKVRHMRRTLAWWLSRAGWQVFTLLLRREGMKGVTRLQRSPYPAMQMRLFFQDMLFNLAPQAAAYKRGNAQEEEAIACIEALARMPQQVVKWGHAAVGECAPALYGMYYNEVVPACDAAARKMVGM